uniref:Pantoate--beta-alanine ligase n=1 Tax=Proboscia inermis TaxID=420281 RepID=A0A7S0CIR9_9STRA|mmetsp:Transcript_47566/g.47993  ORF Transcript_47566/g.47993 Transcript_47566/m.47993 type:complete len:205 (+) Transcript_47566:185-799(+)
MTGVQKQLIFAKGFDDIPEGKSRPGHFRGVATIVTKLFNIVQPTRAYFGQKDAAQCVLIQRIVEDLNIPVEIVIMDTVREADGLAMSSRNAYLTETERQCAPIINKALRAAKEQWLETNIPESSSKVDMHKIPAKDLAATVRQVLNQESLVSEIYYVSVDSCQTMQPLSEVGSSGAVISLAVKVGSVRLIDNIVLNDIQQNGDI